MPGLNISTRRGVLETVAYTGLTGDQHLTDKHKQRILDAKNLEKKKIYKHLADDAPPA